MTRARQALDRGWPAVLLAALALGLSVANWFSFSRPAGVVAGVAAMAASLALPAPVRLGLAALALGAAGLWWGGIRLHELDRSLLVARIGQPASARVVVTGAASRSPFAIRVLAEVRRFDGLPLRERVLLELPAGRAPPQGSVLELRARPVAPRGPETGFDERGWLERKGIHVVLHASGSWQIVGRRGGIGGVGDRLRTAIASALALGTTGERRSLVDRSRARSRRGDRPGVARRVQGLGPLPPARRLGSEHRLHRIRRHRSCIRARSRAGRRSFACDRRDPRLRPRRWLAALGGAGRRCGMPGLRGLASLTSERSLAHDGRRCGRAPRVDATVFARARLPALVCRSRGDLPRHAPPEADLRGVPRAAVARRGRWHLDGVRARDGTDPLAPVRHHPALDGAGERPRRAGDARAARSRIGSGDRRTDPPGRSGRTLVARGGRSCVDRLLGAARCIAPVRPDIVAGSRACRLQGWWSLLRPSGRYPDTSALRH